MSTVDNKFPGKDLTDNDIAGKIPLVAKKSPDHKTRFICAGIEFGGDLIPVMAGPNLAETEDMIMECARAMKAAGAHFLRAGCFKPLTFPYRSEKFYETRDQGLAGLKAAGDAVQIAAMYKDILCWVVAKVHALVLRHAAQRAACATFGWPRWLFA